MKKIIQRVINNELNAVPKPTHYTNIPMPLNSLGDRTFEILLYYIFKERIKVKDKDIVGILDKATLMQGVADKGRDVILYKDKKCTGIIQCKKNKSNISRPEVTKEIIKFLLHYLNNREFISDTNNFTYFFAVSTGFTGAAIGAFNDFGKYVSNEPKFKEWVQDVINDYPTSFGDLNVEDTVNTLYDLFDNINFIKIIPQDIEYWLSEYTNISNVFFKILTVTDNTLIENAINNYLKPILNKLQIKNLDSSECVISFKSYLKKSYAEYSSAKTLVFGNQQKKLEEIYYPLSLHKTTGHRKNSDTKEYKIDKFNDDFLPVYQKALIIDNGGMGKSTLLKWLFLSIIKQNKGIPIFIELRKLNSEHTIINEIIRKLNNSDYEINTSGIINLLKNNSFYIFFDGYDEIIDENRQSVTADIEQFIVNNSTCRFIMTSRPEKALITFADFQEFSVRKLSKEEAFELIKKLDGYEERSRRLIEYINNNEENGIEDFLKNPLLISLLYKKFEYRENIPIKKQEFFAEVFEALFQGHDLSKGDSYIRPKECALSMSDFFQVLRHLGFKCIKQGLEFNESKLEQLINEIKEKIYLKFDASLFLNDLTKAVPLFHKDGLVFKWAHKSIQQYFAAEYICRDSKEDQQKILIALYKSENVESYDLILELCNEIDPVSFRNSIIDIIIKEYFDFYNSSFNNLKSQGKIPQNLIRERIGILFQNREVCLFPRNGKVESNMIKLAAKKWNVSTTSLISLFLGAIEGEHPDYQFIININYVLGFNIKSFLSKSRNNLINDRVPIKGIKLQTPLIENTILYFDDDNVNSEFNTVENFKTINTILKSFLYEFSHDEALLLNSKIERDKIIYKSENYDF